MRIVAVPIPEKSHGIRVWLSLKDSEKLPKHKNPYDFCCNLIHIDKETCEVAQAMGNFSNDVAILVGLKAIELGYKKLKFCRSMGGNATRWASYVRTDDELDYYEVDLMACLKEIRKQGNQ